MKVLGKLLKQIYTDFDAPITNAKDGLYTETVDVSFGAEEVGPVFVLSRVLWCVFHVLSTCLQHSSTAVWTNRSGP